MYSPEQRQAVYDHICERVATDSKSLRAICEEARENGMQFPGITAILKWLGEDQAFAAQYARAKQDQADYLADEVLDIVDEPVIELPEGMEPNVKAEVTRLDMERRKQRVDARKWRAAHLKPKVYGPRTTLQGDSEADPVNVQGKLADGDKRDLARWIAFSLRQGVQATEAEEQGE